MQELQFVPDDSDAASLVLRAQGSDGTVRMYWVPVTDALRRVVADSTPTDPEPDVGPEPTGGSAPVRSVIGKGDGAGHDNAGRAGSRVAVSRVSAPPERESSRAASREKLTLRPSDIQKRLRHGATVPELAAETGLPESRLLPYAHPIEMERRRIAELARQAYPVRVDGPAEHTLWEVLATAFGARGEDVRASEWDAAMDASDSWTVTVSWTRGNRQGATRFSALFRWIPASSPGLGPSTVEPVNSVATDLIDPRFARPVRSVTPVDAGVGDIADVDDGADRSDDAPSADNAGDSGVAPAVELFGNDDRSGGERPQQIRRRRSAATPHWEDVLLGVRTSPRRKK